MRAEFARRLNVSDFRIASPYSGGGQAGPGQLAHAEQLANLRQPVTTLIGAGRTKMADVSPTGTSSFPPQR